MIRVGIIDSGVDGAARSRVVAHHRFVSPTAADGSPNCSAHGSAVARIIVEQAPAVSLLDAQVFGPQLRSSAATVATAIDWLVAQNARLINMSFGLREDRDSLRSACENALAHGVILVAAMPARGAAVFPASYSGVIRATGDARCAPGEISSLQTPQADFGGHVQSADPALAGASMGCAHVSGAIAQLLCIDPDANAQLLLAALTHRAAFHGPEHRGAAI